MNKIKRKFKSTKGASIVLALLFLLFAMTVGSIMLTSATVNLGRTRNMNIQEQNYMAVKSAASLIEAELKKIEFTGSFTKDSKGVLSPKPTKTNPDSADYVSAIIYPELEEWYKDANGLDSKDPNLKKAKMTINIPSQTNFPEVSVTLEVKKDYNIEAVLWCPVPDSDPTKPSVKANMMVLKLTAVLATTETETISSPPVEDSFEGDESYDVTYVTNITYKNPTITKGGSTS